MTSNSLSFGAAGGWEAAGSTSETRMENGKEAMRKWDGSRRVAGVLQEGSKSVAIRRVAGG